MISPPTTVCGIAARPKGQPISTPEGFGAISLVDGLSADIKFHRWDLKDFDLADSHIAGLTGWVRTISVELGGIERHLVQGNSSFWTTCSGASLRSVPATDVHASQNIPNWRGRSSRFWPHRGQEPMPFLGQGQIGAHDVYLFGKYPDGDLAIHLADRTEQDVEDHYDQEETVK